ncbi:MAG: hypothetical protein MZW92_62890 [Comamonadaceae bacterium]|nr:hypothetical protein [Comamonadaceae bacterium]
MPSSRGTAARALHWRRGVSASSATRRSRTTACGPVRVELIDDDAPRAPAETLTPTVQRAGRRDPPARSEQDLHPFAEPYRFDDAGWVANRWCELLPVPLAAKQKLMELEDPVIRLSIVDGYLRTSRSSSAERRAVADPRRLLRVGADEQLAHRRRQARAPAPRRG